MQGDLFGTVSLISEGDTEGNVLKIKNASGFQIFKFRMVITQAMLGENPPTPTTMTYEVISAQGINLSII